MRRFARRVDIELTGRFDGYRATRVTAPATGSLSVRANRLSNQL
jgi:hypothetical protein